MPDKTARKKKVQRKEQKNKTLSCPIKSNDDYQGNFVDKLRKRLEQKRKRSHTKKAIQRLLNGNEVVGLGDSGEEALQVQRNLEEAGYLPAQGVSGNFDEKSDKALRDYQKDLDLIEDGIAGEWVAKKMNGDIPIATPEPVESLLYKNIDVAPLAAKAGISPLFLKAVLEVSNLEPDFYLPYSFKQNPKAVKAANDLNLELFVEYYFGEHYLGKGLAEKLRKSYEKASSENPEFK